MGHSSIVTTQRYLHSQAKEKLRAVETLVEITRKPQFPCQINVKLSENRAVSRSLLVS